LDTYPFPAAISREDEEDYWFLYGERKTSAEVQQVAARRIQAQLAKAKCSR
jgi:hypothetical protein